MRLYRNHYSKEGGGSAGFSFHPSKRLAHKEATKRKKREGEYWETPHEVATPVEVCPTKDGIIAALNHYADHPDNG